MKPLSIPMGSPVMLGQPAKPMPSALSGAIGEMVRGIAGVREAYLPQCYVKGVVEPPTQVLVVVLDTATGPENEKILDAIGQGLVRVLPSGMHLDVWPMSGREGLLSTVRGTRTHIHCPPPPEKKHWWKTLGR